MIQSFTCIFKIVFEWSGGGTSGFCLEPRRWVTEQNKDGEKGGPWRMFNSDCKMVRNPRQASLTRDILLREVKLFGFMKKRFNFATYTFKWQMSFFFSATLFRVVTKRLNKFCVLTRRIKITNMLFLHFLQTGLHYYIYFFLCDTLLCWQQKCKTNLILDKTNKINSLQ